MAACSELEEKNSSLDDSLPLEIYLDDTSDNSLSELSNKLIEESKTGDLKTLSDDEFLHLLKEASTFNKPNNKESDLLKQLRKEVAETEPRENANVNDCDHLHSNILLCSNSTNFASHITFDETIQIPNLNDACTLNSDLNILQSLSLQDLLNPETKSKKSHKSHRTHSLSFDEATPIITDSLSVVTPKAGKKSKSVTNPKIELNKTFLKCSSRTTGPSESLTGDSGQKRKYDALLQSSNLPYEPLINDCDIPLPTDSTTEDDEKENLIEIEMEEIKALNSDKENKPSEAPQKEQQQPEKAKIIDKNNTRFYLESKEVETSVALSLHSLVTSMENGQMGFPIVPWPRSLQVQSLLDEKNQILAADINGNPFTRTARPTIASLVSTNYLDYSNTNSASENKNRKNKRLRNTVSKGVLSESIAGHRGEEDIDTLLQYINSSDKKGKNNKGNPQNPLLGGKNAAQESDKKKSAGKDIKNCHKNIVEKKKLSRSNSLENIVSDRHEEKSSALSYESSAILDKPLKNTKSASLDKSFEKALDINSNVQSGFPDAYEKSKDISSTDESTGQSSNFEPSGSDVSSFAADFYSTANVSSQTVEETGFLIVKKKQRKKQGKRSESYRWRNAQAQRKKGMMIPLAESKCGKQDSRRKSTSSVPHSEHSSADNSDLDSVHSLPVRGSVPHPKQPHPHTTPSSSSSTPQASYADIARMPISKLSSPSPCIMTYSNPGSSVAKQQISDQESKEVESSSNIPCIKQVQENVTVSTESSSPVTEISDTLLESDVKVRCHAKSTREINTQTEPEPSSCEPEKLKIEESSSKSLSNPSCSCPLKKNCNCSKPIAHCRQKLKSSEIPPVIMDNMPAESNACNVSFGFGVEEVLQMTPTEAGAMCKNSKNNKTITKVVNKTQSANKSLQSTCIPPTKVNDLPNETSSHLKTVCYGTGRNICYSESKVNTKKFNLSEITSFLGKEFQCIENELGVSKSKSSKVMYYADSAEEA